jgi:hypothetical protein
MTKEHNGFMALDNDEMYQISGGNCLLCTIFGDVGYRLEGSERANARRVGRIMTGVSQLLSRIFHGNG